MKITHEKRPFVQPPSIITSQNNDKISQHKVHNILYKMQRKSPLTSMHDVVTETNNIVFKTGGKSP